MPAALRAAGIPATSLTVPAMLHILLSLNETEEQMGEDSYLDSYWEDRYELAHAEPPYESDGPSVALDHDTEDGFPYDVRDCSDDADALASVWGMDEDYGGYWDE